MSVATVFEPRGLPAVAPSFTPAAETASVATPAAAPAAAPAAPVAPNDAAGGAPTEYERLAARVDAAVVAARALDPAPRAAALELQGSIEAFHRHALVTMVRTLRADPRGRELLHGMVDAPEVWAMLALHGIVRGAPTPAADEPPPAPEPPAPPPALVALESRRTRREARAREGWVAGPALRDVPETHPVRVDGPQGEGSAIVTRRGASVQAFRNACAHQGLPLDRATIDAEGTLVCPWHGFRFDCATGECLTAPQAQLEPLECRVEDGVVHVRIA